MELRRRRFMPSDFADVQQRFGDRFERMELTAIETIFWPVFRHRLLLTMRQTVPLDAVEEGLLRIIISGVSELSDAARFIGCSERYAEIIAKELGNRAGGLLDPLLDMHGSKPSPTSAAGSALASCSRGVVTDREVLLVRDAVFGQWIDLGERRFRCKPLEKEVESPARWLGSHVSSKAKDVEDVVQDAIRTQSSDQEVAASQFDELGELQWIRLTLACYQSESHQSGRFLLFNPENYDQPLADLSNDFEQLLGRDGGVKTYFPDDALGTTRAFWNSLAARTKTAYAEDEISKKREHVGKLKQALTAVEKGGVKTERGPSAPRSSLTEMVLASNLALKAGALNDAVTAFRSAVESLIIACSAEAGLEAELSNLANSASQLRLLNKLPEDNVELLFSIIKNAEGWTEIDGEDLLKQSQVSSQLPGCLASIDLLARELGVSDDPAQQAAKPNGPEQAVQQQARAEIDRQQTELERLEELLASAPRTRHLRVEDHPQILRKALREAQEVLILISPWIKMRVLSQYLPDLDSALNRGCEIWIGYGMPRSDFHRDRSDEKALDTLRKRERERRLFLVELGTHEKVLIKDDDLFVNTSFNWLSYAGGDGRRESGLLQEGGVQSIKEEFLADLKERQLQTSR
jgi:hypothetical protein